MKFEQLKEFKSTKKIQKYLKSLPEPKDMEDALRHQFWIISQIEYEWKHANRTSAVHAMDAYHNKIYHKWFTKKKQPR